MNESLRETFRKGLKSQTQSKFTTIAAVVDAVDEKAFTIDVKPVDEGAEVFFVRLRASLDDADTGFIQVPKVGSTVLISTINSDWNRAFLSLATELEKVLIKIGDSTMEVNVEGVTINGGSLGGLVKWKELQKELEKTNAVVEAIIHTLKNWAPIASDGGAAIKPFLGTALAGKAVGNYEGIENEKVKHG